MSERWREILQQLTSELERQTVTGFEKIVRIGLIGSCLLKSVFFLFYPSMFLSFSKLDFVGDFSIVVMFRILCLCL